MDDKNRISSKEALEAAASSSKESQYAKTDLLPPLLLEYETFVATLQQQVDFYKTEHTMLRSDLMELVTENRCLSDKLKDVLGTKFTKESTISPRHKKESDMLANLQQQLSLTAQEKDSAIEMWHMSLREVDNLEDALKSYQDNRNTDLAQKNIEDMKQDFSNAITMLESKLATTRSNLAKEKTAREEVQKKLEESLQENLTLTLSLKSRQQELEEALEGQCATARKLQVVERTSEELQEQVETIKKAENDMELALTQCHAHIDELVKKKLEAHEKVSESLQVVECAMVEKNAAIFGETQAREENVQLQKIMAGIVDEAGARVKEEIENMKQQYNKKLEVLLRDMKKMEDENKEKEKKLQKEIQEKHVLEGEIQKMQIESPIAKHMLEKKITMAYNELSDLKRCNLQLGIEKENLRSEMERVQESHALEIRKMNMEQHFMEERVLGLQAQLEAENRAKAKMGEHIDKLAEQVHLLEQELEKRRLMSKKELQDWQQQQHEQEHQELVTQIQEIQKQSNTTASELEHHLQKQHLMKTKYQRAMKTMTEKFVKRLQELRSEANALKREKKELEGHLKKLQDEVATHAPSLKNDM